MTFERQLLVALSLASFCRVARAAVLPQYDVEAQCHLGVSAAGETANADFDTCMNTETIDREKARRQALHAPVRSMTYCNDIADTGDGGSYTTLAHCLELEKNANATPKD